MLITVAGENSFKLGGFALGVCRREYLYGMVVEVVHWWIIVHDESGLRRHTLHGSLVSTW